MPIKPELRQVIEARNSRPVEQSLKSIAETLMTQLKAEVKMEELKMLIQRSGIDVRNVFDLIDVSQRGYLTYVDLIKYFDKYGNANTEDLEGLVRRFNKDKLNGRISMPDFVDNLRL